MIIIRFPAKACFISISGTSASHRSDLFCVDITSKTSFCRMSILLLILVSSPVSAYNSGNTTVITRKAPRKQALLDRKFVFIQESSAFQSSSLRAERSNPGIQTSTSLNSLSTPTKLKPTIVTTKNSNQEPGLLRPSGTRNDAESQDVYNESSWDNYATETDDNLGVKAWITNLPK